MDVEAKINKMAASKVVDINEVAKTQLMEASFTKACRSLAHMQAIILYEIRQEKVSKLIEIEAYNDVMINFYKEQKDLKELIPKDIFEVFLI